MKAILCEFANSAIKTNSQFKGKYESLVIRRGHKRSIVAIGHKLLEVIFIIIKTKLPYKDPTIDNEKMTVDRNSARWIKSLEKFGYLESMKKAA